MRYPSSQQHWHRALKRATWVQDIRVDGRNNLLEIARVLALHASWETLETWPGWDTLTAKTGLSDTSVGRWLQELRVRGWLEVIETGSTPATRPMALALPNGRIISRDEGNRRAVYALRIPLSPDEALRWAAEAIAAQAAQEAATVAAEPLTLTADDVAGEVSDQAEPVSFGDKKGRPTCLFSVGKKTWVSGYAREARIVDDCGNPVADRWGGNDQTSALRAPGFDEEQGRAWARKVPTSGFEMLIAAAWLRWRLPVFGRVTRKAVRAAIRPFWAAGWSNLDVVHAMDHRPAAFGLAGGTPIGRGDDAATDAQSAWWFIKARLGVWRDVDGRPRPGFYQGRGRNRALRQAVVEHHGRAAAQLLDDHDAELTVAHIVAHGRRAARELGSPAVPQPRRPRPTGAAHAGTADEAVRAAAAEQLEQALAAKRARAVEHETAEPQTKFGAQVAARLAAARAELAARTAAVVPVAAVDSDQLTAQERHERARAIARGHRRATARQCPRVGKPRS